MAMPKLSEAAEQAIENIAREQLNIETLDVRGRDRLDFHDLPVWMLRAALEAAYLAGMVDHHQER